MNVKLRSSLTVEAVVSVEKLFVHYFLTFEQWIQIFLKTDLYVF